MVSPLWLLISLVLAITQPACKWVVRLCVSALSVDLRLFGGHLYVARVTNVIRSVCLSGKRHNKTQMGLSKGYRSISSVLFIHLTVFKHYSWLLWAYLSLHWYFFRLSRGSGEGFPRQLRNNNTSTWKHLKVLLFRSPGYLDWLLRNSGFFFI